MQIGVMVELDEGLERHPETAAIVQERVMVIGDAPWPGIEIEAGVELAPLRRAAELRVDVAASERPVSSARPEVVLEYANLVAGALELDRRRHSGEPGAEDDDRGAFGIAVELDRTAVWRFLRMPKASHRLVGGRSANTRANDLKQSSPAEGRRRLIHRSVHLLVGGTIVAPSIASSKTAKVWRYDRPSNAARTSASDCACASTRPAAAAISSIDACGSPPDGAASLISATIFASPG